MIQSRQFQQRLLLAIFVLSGFAGLIYQSIWSHYLGLFLGHAAYAQALVLAIFMGGMAAGAAWVARAGERWKNLVLGYALVEAVIGIFGLLFHLGFLGVVGLSYDTLIPAVGSPWGVSAYKWFVAATLILPQTILLGMTFPLMSGGLIRRLPGQDGSMLGGLYFTNSIGAAIGALVAAFILMPRLGLPGSMAIAGGVNLVVAGLAWVVGRTPEPAAPFKREMRGASEGERGRRLLVIVLCGTALSGAASFVYEIVWIRMLSLAVGTTLHAFELMLASFIAGIAFGGLWIRKRADSTDNPLRLVGWLQIWMGLTALLSLVMYANAFEWIGWLMGSLGRNDGAYLLFNFGTAALAMLIMLPSAFFAGTTLPLFTVTLLRDKQGEGSIGRVYAWNTLGAILGVFAAIHLLIPMLGLKLALCLAAAVDMGIGLTLLRWQADSVVAFRRFAVGGVVVVLALVMSISLVPFDPMRLASGVFRTGESRLGEGDQVVFYRDGKTSSVSVVASPSGVVRIATNGKIDASIRVVGQGEPQMDEPTMVLAAALPLAMHPEPRTVGVIGFGSGLTTHALLADHRLTQVDTVEIEEAMVEGAAAFGEHVERAYLDPRSRIIIDDAKSYFSGQQAKYDIIVSEPSNPWISGVGALFSKEFYEFIPRHLDEGGLLLQWIQLYEIDEKLIASILNALTPAFEDYVAYLSNHSDLLIVASPKGPVPEPDFDRLLQMGLGADLERLGLSTGEQISFRKVADARILRAIARSFPGRVNSDYFPVLSLEAPRTRFRGVSARGIHQLPLLEMPFLEVLGVRELRDSDAPLVPLAHFPADIEHAQALALARALKGIATEASDRPEVDAAAGVGAALRAAGMQCGEGLGGPGRSNLLSNLYEAAVLALPYLDAESQQGVFSEPQWLPCEGLPMDLGALLSLLERVALRDWNSVYPEAERWLAGSQGRDEVYRRFDPIALAAMQLSLADRGDWEQIGVVEERFGREVRAVGGFGVMRTLLLALAAEEAGP